MATAYIGLGSNLDHPRQQIKDALAELELPDQTRLLTASSLYCSPPMGPDDQPDYINAVAQIATMLQPLQLLEALQGIEQAHHRMRKRHWGERTLDLDLLLYDDRVLTDGKLLLPREDINRYAFVLGPLAEIAATARHPLTAVSYADMWAAFDDREQPLTRIDWPPAASPVVE